MTAIELKRLPARWDVLDGWDTPSWNVQTRRVVARRLNEVPERRFFDAAEWALLEAVIARLLPHPARALPIPVAGFIDDKLERDLGDGYRYTDTPPLREAWRLGLAALGREAIARHGRAFVTLEAALQDEVLTAIQHGDAKADWPYPPRRFFQDILLKTVVSFHYAHPTAWTEIGFGGPASPRGYVRLGLDRRDGWEPPFAPWPTK